MVRKYIELNNVLKIKFLVATGGQAKQFIQNKEVKVNGEIETRNKKKLFSGDIVEFKDKKYTIEEEICFKEIN